MIYGKPFNIAIIGGGLMGHGIAQEFAQHGYEVTIFEKDGDRRNGIPGRIEANLKLLAEQGVMKDEAVEAALKRIHVSDAFEAAVEGAEYVVEAVFEDLPLKQAIFRRLDQVCPPEVILASNSSSFTPTDYATGTTYPGRILGTHYFNPPYLVPLVEVVKGPATSEEAVTRATTLLKGLGKKVVLVRKESAGFIANRIQIALFREAFNVVEQGIATPEEVDLAIKNSFGRRLGVMGPFEQCDIIGADLKLAIYKALIPHISHSQTPPPILETRVAKGKLGIKTGEGFYRWTPESARAMNRNLRQWLIGVNGLERSLNRLSVEKGEPKNESDEGEQDARGHDG